MKDKQLRLRMSERRYNKLKLYAQEKDKTMTQVVDELIDSLPMTENGNSALRAATLTSTNIAD